MIFFLKRFKSWFISLDKKIPKYIKRLVGEDYQRVENKDAASEQVEKIVTDDDGNAQSVEPADF